MSLSIEAIVGILCLIVALPPSILVLVNMFEIRKIHSRSEGYVPSHHCTRYQHPFAVSRPSKAYSHDIAEANIPIYSHSIRIDLAYSLIGASTKGLGFSSQSTQQQDVPQFDTTRPWQW
ncbi:hypothetical protein B0O99DRAFT_686066 [Bisporella sp. PMI_857]|nr:hypothetical protein B0O99DRAFT_686066 [Bisporella sp. PMI_857]